MANCAVKRTGYSSFKVAVTMKTRYEKAPRNRRLYTCKSNTQKCTMFDACYQSEQYLIDSGLTFDQITVDKLLRASKRLGLLLSMDIFEQRKIAANYLYERKQRLNFTC